MLEGKTGSELKIGNRIPEEISTLFLRNDDHFYSIESIHTGEKYCAGKNAFFVVKY